MLLCLVSIYTCANIQLNSHQNQGGTAPVRVTVQPSRNQMDAVGWNNLWER